MDKLLARSCVYAKIGELVQGRLTPTEDIIIPGISSSFFNTKTFVYSNEGESKFQVREFVYEAIYLYLKLKNGTSFKALQKGLSSELIKNFIQQEFRNISIIQDTNIPEGKGLSSGPTDIISVLLALNKYFNTQFDKSTIYKLCALVLPTDPVLDDNIDMIFNPVSGEKVFNLSPQDFGIIYFDANKTSTCNTKEIFDKLEYSSQEYVDFNIVLEKYQNGALSNNSELIFEAITMSAIINQRLNPKPKFELLLNFVRENNYGLFVSHTGTIMGIVTSSENVNKAYDQSFNFIKENWKTRAYFDTSKKSLLSIS